VDIGTGTNRLCLRADWIEGRKHGVTMRTTVLWGGNLHSRIYGALFNEGVHGERMDFISLGCALINMAECVQFAEPHLGRRWS
jgi:hypothetical protein